MSYDTIHQKCEVVAHFRLHERPHIISFLWNEKKYKVVEQSLVVNAHKGEVPVWLFHVATESASFKLRFDADVMQWWVEELMWDNSSLN